MGKHDLTTNPDPVIISIPKNMESYQEKLDTIQVLLLNINKSEWPSIIEELKNTSKKYL